MGLGMGLRLGLGLGLGLGFGLGLGLGMGYRKSLNNGYSTVGYIHGLHGLRGSVPGGSDHVKRSVSRSTISRVYSRPSRPSRPSRLCARADQLSQGCITTLF